MEFIKGVQGLALGLVILFLGGAVWVAAALMQYNAMARLFAIITVLGLLIALFSPIWYWIGDTIRKGAT